MAGMTTDESWTWAWSTDEEIWTTGFSTRHDATVDGAHGCDDGFTVALARPLPLSYDVDQWDLDCAREDDHDLADWLVDYFINCNDDCDYEGDAFTGAGVDSALRQDLEGCTTSVQASEALRRWIDRNGGFPGGRALDIKWVADIRREDAALIRYRPGRRAYGYESPYAIQLPVAGTRALSNREEAQGIGYGMGDMPNYDRLGSPAP